MFDAARAKPAIDAKALKEIAKVAEIAKVFYEMSDKRIALSEVASCVDSEARATYAASIEAMILSEEIQMAALVRIVGSHNSACDVLDAFCEDGKRGVYDFLESAHSPLFA